MIARDTRDDPFASRDRDGDRDTPSILRTIPSSSHAMTELSATLRRIGETESLPPSTRTAAREVLAGRSTLSQMLDDAFYAERRRPGDGSAAESREEGIRWV